MNIERGKANMNIRIAVRVDFYATLQRVFATRSMRFDLDPSATVGQLLAQLCKTDGERNSIFQSPETIRKDVRVLRNGRDINFLNGLGTQLHGEDKIAIFPPVAGG